MPPPSRRAVLQKACVGLGVALAGCSTITDEGDQSAPDPDTSASPTTDNPTTASSTTTASPTETAASLCATHELHVSEVTRSELEDEAYEIVAFENLSARKRRTFDEAHDGHAPNVTPREWRGTVNYGDDEHSVPLVVRRNGTLYDAEIYTVDYRC